MSGLSKPVQFSFFKWRDAYPNHGAARLKKARSIPKNPACQIPAEIIAKVLLSRRKYSLGPIRLVRYLAPCQASNSRIPWRTASSNITIPIDFPEVHDMTAIMLSLNHWRSRATRPSTFTYMLEAD